jgi:hypothetical protein
MFSALCITSSAKSEITQSAKSRVVVPLDGAIAAARLAPLFYFVTVWNSIFPLVETVSQRGRDLKGDIAVGAAHRLSAACPLALMCEKS